MPKEMITTQHYEVHHTSTPDENGMSSGGVEHHMTTLAVRWGETGVEIVTYDGPTAQRIDIDGHYANVDLSRTDINNLIRTLRRARDRTYGRDE